MSLGKNSLICGALLLPLPCWAVTPFYARAFVVAGSSEPNFTDGSFIQATFKHPRGLVVSADSKTLYVADTDNHAIRAVALAAQNEVSTVVANGQAGQADGDISTARLNRPVSPGLFPRDLLVFLDLGSHRLRMLNLKRNVLSTAYASKPTPQYPNGETITASDVAYDVPNSRVYFYDPVAKELRALSLDRGTLAHLGPLPDFLPEFSSLVLAGPVLCYYNKGNGQIRRLQIGDQDLGASDLNLHDRPLKITPLALVAPDAEGFGAFQSSPGQWKLLLWDTHSVSLRWINPLNNQVGEQQLGDHLGNLLGAPLLRGSLSASYDPASKIFYIAETQGNQVLGIRNVNWQMRGGDHAGKFLRDYDYPAEKAPGVTRILWLSSSIGYEGPPPDQEINRERRLATQFEFNLNLLSALDGTGRRFEVLCKAECGTCMGGGVAGFFLHQEDLLKYYHIDQAILILDYYTLYAENSAVQRTKTVDDIPALNADAEWALAPRENKEKSYGPITRRILAHAAKIKHLSESGQLLGGFEFNQFNDPEDQTITLDLMRKLSNKAVALANKLNVKLTYAYIPTKNLVSLAEGSTSSESSTDNLSRPLAELAKPLGIRYLDLSEDLRLVDPAVFPLYATANSHLLERGHQWLGFLLARKYLQP